MWTTRRQRSLWVSSCLQPCQTPFKEGREELKHDHCCTPVFFLLLQSSADLCSSMDVWMCCLPFQSLHGARWLWRASWVPSLRGSAPCCDPTSSLSGVAAARRHLKDTGRGGGRWHHLCGGAGRGAAPGGGEAHKPEDTPHDHHLRWAQAPQLAILRGCWTRVFRSCAISPSCCGRTLCLKEGCVNGLYKRLRGRGGGRQLTWGEVEEALVLKGAADVAVRFWAAGRLAGSEALQRG